MVKQVLSIKTDNDCISNHLLISQDNPKGLLLMFPGGNQSCDRPILHFSRKAMLLAGYDVLSFSYEGLRNHKLSKEEDLQIVIDEISKAIDKVNAKSYSRVFILSRCFGNLVAAGIRRSFDFEVYRHSFLAPIPPSINDIVEFGGLVITGTSDPYMNEADREQLMGILRYSSGSTTAPYVVQDNPTSMSTDSTGLRGTMDIGILVRDSEKDIDSSSNRHINRFKSNNILDYLYRRTIIELIIGGVLGIALGISTYMEYFL